MALMKTHFQKAKKRKNKNQSKRNHWQAAAAAAGRGRVHRLHLSCLSTTQPSGRRKGGPPTHVTTKVSPASEE